MRRALLCAVLAGSLPSSAGAQSTMLSEAEALSRLSSDSPRVRAIRAGVELARAGVVAAARWPNPTVTVDRESVAGVTEYLSRVTQPLPITGRRGLEVLSASALLSASASRADEEVRRVQADLRLAFAELVAAQTRERELTGARDRLQGLADILARRETAGDAAGFDRLRAERELLELHTDLAAAAADRTRAQLELAGFLSGELVGAPIVAVSGSRSVSEIPALAALIEQAEAVRGELVALRHDLESARLASRAAERRLVPEPEVVAGTKSSTLASGVGSVVAVHAAIPLFDRARPERAIADARAAQAQARADSFRLVLRSQVAALREAVIQRRAAADRYRAQAVETAAQLERIAQVSYDAGERGILDLLDAYRLGASARVRQTALDLSVRQAEIELGFATGWEGS